MLCNLIGNEPKDLDFCNQTFLCARVYGLGTRLSIPGRGQLVELCT